VPTKLKTVVPARKKKRKLPNVLVVKVDPVAEATKKTLTTKRMRRKNPTHPSTKKMMYVQCFERLTRF